ncbi:MAG: hypothetical protein ACFFBD_16430, partial [Candidatus Hodarchaeota archaeon]
TRKTGGIAISVIRLGDEGPEALLSTPLYFLKDRGEEAGTKFLDNIAIYYLTAIAQASAYHEGLFGPLPVRGYPNKEVLLFSFRTLDTTLHDRRFAGKGYFFFCIFLRKGTTSIVARSMLEDFLKDYTSQITDISQLTRSMLLEIVNEIITMLLY